MARSWLSRLPLPLRTLRDFDRLATALVDFERSRAFHQGEVGWSLARMRRLNILLGRPLRGLPVVHVAGSKGKGSVCLLVESLLRRQGLRTGLYLSPHVDGWNERIQLDGAPLDPVVMGACVEQVVRRAAGRFAEPPTLFEILTGAAFVAFAQARCDVAVIEVGIGGRLDATNVARADVAVVTSIELEHTAVLGQTLAAIAGEKAGILKRGCHAISGLPPKSRAAAVLRTVARRVGARLDEWSRGIRARLRTVASEPELDLALPGGVRLRLPVPAGGPFAARNAALAVAAVQRLAERRAGLGIVLSEARLADGLRTALLPARFECVSTSPLVLRDGAHTPRSLRAIALAAAERLRPRRPVVLFALKNDKRLASCLRALAGSIGPLVATNVPGGRSTDPQEIVAVARSLGIMARAEADPGRAFALARRWAGRNGAVLVTGSFWLSGAVRQWLPEDRPVHGRR